MDHRTASDGNAPGVHVLVQGLIVVERVIAFVFAKCATRCHLTMELSLAAVDLNDRTPLPIVGHRSLPTNGMSLW